MENLPEAIQNKIMYLTLSHPIADMIKHTKWFYRLKRRAENDCYSISDVQAEFDYELIEDECIECGGELHSKEFIRCWSCVFCTIKCLLENNTPWAFRICDICKAHFDVNVLCFSCDESPKD